MKQILTPTCIFTIIVKTLLLLCLVSPSLVYGKSLKVAIFYPHEDPFWNKAVFFTKEAAADLGVELQAYNANDDPDRMLAQVNAAVRGGIDGIIFPAFQNTGEQVLQIAEDNKTPAILINSQLPEKDLLPRTKYEYWISSVLPDDVRAGTLLTQQLISEARSKGIERFHVLAIEGNPKDESSIDRVRGLKNYLKHLKGLDAFKTVTGKWDRQTAYEQFKDYYSSHSNVNIVWCANDNMALGVVKAVQELDLRRRIVVGGVDWDKDAIDAIQQDLMQVSVGGHFLDGARAVVLLFDYLKAVDFANEQLQFESAMTAVTKNNFQQLAPILSADAQWMDFGKFSKARNPGLKLYRFDLFEIAAEIESTWASLPLSEEEKAWLARHKTIRMGVDSNYAPYSLVDEKGRYEGISADFVKKISARLGIDMEMVPGLTWAELLDGVKNRTVDVVTTVRKTPEREAFMNFSQDYIPTPLVIVARKDYDHIKTRSDIADKKVALVKNYSSSQKIVDQYPSVEPYWTADILEALRAVSTGNADVFVGSQGTISYLITKNAITNLRVAAVFEEGLDGQRFAVRKDWPEFAAILDKAIDSISEGERLEIMGQWIQLGLPPEGPKELVLTAEEKAWLAEHKDLRLGIDAASAPFEFLDATKVYAGIASDYVRILNERVKINMAPVPGLIWSQVMDLAKAGAIDVLPCISKTPGRSEFLLFTEPYVSFPMVIVTRQDAPFISGVQDFSDNRVAVVKGYASQELLERDYPARKFFLADNLEEALRAVSEGKVDAFVDNLASISYTAQKIGISNLKVAMTTPYSFDLAFAVRKDWPILVKILNKSLDSIPDSKKAEINNRWINVRFERRVAWAPVLKVMIPILILAALVLFAFVRWNRRLTQEVIERKKAEVQLREVEEHSRLLLESAGEGIIGVGRDGKIIFVNPAAGEALGYATDEFVGQDLHSLIHHSHADGSPYPQENCPMDKSVSLGAISHVDDEVLWRKDGKSFHAVYSSNPIQKDGSITGAVVVFRDISERKEAEHAIRESEERLSTILETTNQGFWLVDNDASTLDVNNAMCKILYRTKEEIIGRKIYDFVDEENIEKVRGQERVRSESKRSLYEVSLMRSDGKRVPCLVNASPLLGGGGNKIGSFGMFTDITDRKHIEEELRRNVEELERFNKLAIGREKKMIHLKEEINELLFQLNQDKRYKIVK